MKILSKLNELFNLLEGNKPRKKAKILPQKPMPTTLYRFHDFTAGEINELFLDMLTPVASFIDDISIELLNYDQLLLAEVKLKSFLRPFSFTAKTCLIDVWHDNWTSSAVFEFVDIKIHSLSVLPQWLQKWCGKKIIGLISFGGSIFQKNDDQQKASFYLQEQLLYINFKPWLQNHFNNNNNSEQSISPWLIQLFSSAENQPIKGQRYIKNHIIFGAEIKGDIPLLRLYIYRMPASLYKSNHTELKDLSSPKLSLLGNWLEWLFAITTSFLLVSFLVPFGMAYVRLEPIRLDDIFAIPFIFLYNSFIVLIPFLIFRIVLMPMRRLWDSRQGHIEILKAEVARDQVFLPLLREWIIALQTKEISHIPLSLLNKIRSLLVKIGNQKYLLFEKISIIEQRRRRYASIIIISYLGVCLLEILFLTGVLPTPYFFVNQINKLLSVLLLDK